MLTFYCFFSFWYLQGAIAAVAALPLADLNPYVITFGQPNTLDAPCDLITSTRWYRFINTKETPYVGLTNDPVPFVPGLGADSFGHMILLSNYYTGFAYIGLDAQDFFGPLNVGGFEAHSMVSKTENTLSWRMLRILFAPLAVFQTQSALKIRNVRLGNVLPKHTIRSIAVSESIVRQTRAARKRVDVTAESVYRNLKAVKAAMKILTVLVVSVFSFIALEAVERWTITVSVGGEQTVSPVDAKESRTFNVKRK